MAFSMTRHARERTTARNIPPMIVEMIVEYGDSRECGAGARSYVLTGNSMRAIRKVAGKEIAKVIEPYRTQKAYVIENAGRIITAAFAYTH
ncbi:hypothetical protein [Oharaeibacter diazotrophicus]|uniref:DUF4258 domain-containing protein n=1 Tax=Oharaeibacter diazotrophicus TaxID=1920512 RepID=A0A4R6RPX8_9HYPH|nr:hypothetical protein [Oharaeibacter diazotrophicus]TDP88712.1 hypothetical protein EDD54_0008 [Oharaeibacter diazotrophicus]BBE74931.1 hypothetical protein OHA_3_00019 [Pleomorphomonas sp. SM30]GLS79226.1 hypothetical protein GCM10007904_45640 [Oharaeibacter diazotrophicus]